MIYLVIMPVLLLFMPWVMVRFIFSTPNTQKTSFLKSLPYSVTAAGLWALAMVAPNIPISAETDTFTMHMLGGVVATILFLYAAKVYGWKFETGWQPWVALFFFVSALGVVNELFELFLNQIGYPGMILGDERWDLLANTIGALSAYGLHAIGASLNKRYNAKRTHP